ncbi:hypothetical protein MTR67_015202 [Solanum verrucosum]|uniref:Chitin-binding type-1 domain-containing protein n=1 Tax=Solanum verrucosum TaxID=315347 RepID=A0AAF0TII2_SOLVR|nr:hypothetical protein MTR67_015202 [Solanum verrucosum]
MNKCADTKVATKNVLLDSVVVGWVIAEQRLSIAAISTVTSNVHLHPHLHPHLHLHRDDVECKQEAVIFTTSCELAREREPFWGTFREATASLPRVAPRGMVVTMGCEDSRGHGSIWGYCGTTKDHCGKPRCQSQCPPPPPPPPPPPYAIGRCGMQAGGRKCPTGLCCSSSGWCGTTEYYCAKQWCQSQCNTITSSTMSGTETFLLDGVV